MQRASRVPRSTGSFSRDVDKLLSCRRETALQGRSVMTKSGRLELGDNIYGHYRSIFNHCDAIGPQISNSAKNAK